MPEVTSHKVIELGLEGSGQERQGLNQNSPEAGRAHNQVAGALQQKQGSATTHSLIPQNHVAEQESKSEVPSRVHDS